MNQRALEIIIVLLVLLLLLIFGAGYYLKNKKNFEIAPDNQAELSQEADNDEADSVGRDYGAMSEEEQEAEKQKLLEKLSPKNKYEDASEEEQELERQKLLDKIDGPENDNITSSEMEAEKENLLNKLK